MNIDPAIIAFGLLAAFASAACCSIALASLVIGAVTRRGGESWPLAGLGLFWAAVAAACAMVTR